MYNLSPAICVCVWVQLFYSPRNPLTPRHGSLLPLICPFFMGQGCYLYTCSVTWYSDPCPTWHIWQKLPLVPLHLSQGNRRLVAPYILLSSLLSIVSYLEGSVMRGASALIAADHLNRFSSSSPSVIHVARDWHVLWPDLSLALASLYPDSARDPVGDLWRYLVTTIYQ